MFNRDNLIALYKDAAFKGEFIAGYINKNIHQHVADKEYSNAFGILVEDKGNDQRPALSSAPVDAIKRTFLAIASYGLSFDKNNKEVYVFAEYSDNNRVEVATIIGYRGMQRIINSTNGVRSVSTEIVYENDSFTWLGANQRPNYASNGRNQQSPLVCGFTVITFTNGTVLCHKCSSTELEEIERQNIQSIIDIGGAPENSLYTSAWKERCLRICTLRASFREHQHVFITNKELIQDTEKTLANTSDAGAFEQLLNEVNESERSVSNL